MKKRIVFIILVAIYIVVFVAMVLFERRYAKLNNITNASFYKGDLLSNLNNFEKKSHIYENCKEFPS